MKVEKPKKEEMVASDPIQAVISSTKPQDNFWEITDLPSKFKLYAPGTKILARPLKVLEIKMLSTLNTDNINFVLNDIIGRCVTGIRVEDICTADKLYIIFWLRANTYRDSSYSIDFVCPDCKAKGKYDKLSVVVNQYKWLAARAWCSKNGFSFRIMTERELFGKKK